MEKNTHALRYLTKSKFVRSIFLQVISILLFVSVGIIAIVFFSFASEINKNIILDRQKQLAVIEDAISQRMEEVSSIAYHIGIDPAFYMEPVSGERYSGYEMSNTLARYLTGNTFIEYLAYFRLSEPEKIYTSKGELSFKNFWSTYFELDEETAKNYIDCVKNISRPTVVSLSLGTADNSFFAYTCPLPQFSVTPQAYVLMLIPFGEIVPLLESQLMHSTGEIAIFDADGNQIYKLSTLHEQVDIDASLCDGTDDEVYFTDNGNKYVMHRRISASNGWTYVSVIRLRDIISGLANKQIVFIILLLVLMFVAIFAMLICIIVQYKPISNLAVAVTDTADKKNKLIDESTLLSNTFATLKDDSEKKQKFETAYHEAEAANKAKSAFLSSMSHDIRTPMNAIIGMTAIAYKHVDDTAYVRDCLEKIQVASQYLLDIINNVLDMSRIESGRFILAKEIVVLPRLIFGLETILSQNVAAKKQKLIVEVENIDNEVVIGDNVRITQVFMNILSNSVKFTPDGGTIRLHVQQSAVQEEGYGTYVFTFSDTGIGMTPEFVQRVFDTFSRASEPGISQIEGTGLGMAIAKNLVSLMGGTINCESERGKGTTFTVTLHMKIADDNYVPDGCAADAMQNRLNYSAEVTADFTGRRILIVEDNDLNREIACKIVSETGAELVEATDGKEAVDIFASHPAGFFDAVLMDLQMPVMSGYEATMSIRALTHGDAQTIPIFALTASTFDEDVRQVKEAGMTGHISKPYTLETLCRILQSVFV